MREFKIGDRVIAKEDTLTKRGAIGRKGTIQSILTDPAGPIATVAIDGFPYTTAADHHAFYATSLRHLVKKKKSPPHPLAGYRVFIYANDIQRAKDAQAENSRSQEVTVYFHPESEAPCGGLVDGTFIEVTKK